MERDARTVRIGGLCGLVGTLLYIALALSDPYIGPQTKTTQDFLAAFGAPPYDSINMALHFVFAAAAALWLVGFVGLKRLLTEERPSLAVTLGTLFGVVACAVMVQMMIVQGSVMVEMGRAYRAATDDAGRQAIVALYRGLRDIDYGMDLTFDAFFFTAWLLLSVVMLRHRSFGRVLGGIGLVLFVLAAIFNLRAAPDPPEFDVGPFAAFWLLAIYVQTWRAARSSPRLVGETVSA